MTFPCRIFLLGGGANAELKSLATLKRNYDTTVPHEASLDFHAEGGVSFVVELLSSSSLGWSQALTWTWDW